MNPVPRESGKNSYLNLSKASQYLASDQTGCYPYLEIGLEVIMEKETPIFFICFQLITNQCGEHRVLKIEFCPSHGVNVIDVHQDELGAKTPNQTA